MNKFIGIGYICKDPELRFSPAGVAVANFSIAINEGWGDKKQTTFLNVVCFNKQAENCAEYIKKGSLVAIDGRIQTRNYENKEGNKVYVTEIIANSVKFLDSKGKKENNDLGNEVNIDSDEISF